MWSEGNDKSASYYKSLQKKYDEYVQLYLFLNNGSSAGITPFAEFYWRFSYYVKYEDPSLVGAGNV